MAQTTEEKNHELVRNYYGEVLASKQDLQTNACCTGDSLPIPYRGLIDQIHPEILDKFYGCGSPLPFALDGITAVDLGCGTGRDSYLLSKLVGPDGRVIGIDMTDNQLAVARKHLPEQMARFGYAQPNIRFEKALIEDLSTAGIEDNSVDLVVSNCVINLALDKEQVFREIFRILKPGGELFFADIFADRRIPEAVAHDPLLRGECLGGAMYFEDFRRILARMGCLDYRIVTAAPLELQPQVAQHTGNIRFTSASVRTFKLDLEDRCEDFGQVAKYLGTLPAGPHGFRLDDHHLFETGRYLAVCGNTAQMLADTRYAKHFQIVGDRSTHYGLFDCVDPTEAEGSTGACC